MEVFYCTLDMLQRSKSRLQKFQGVRYCPWRFYLAIILFLFLFHSVGIASDGEEFNLKYAGKVMRLRKLSQFKAGEFAPIFDYYSDYSKDLRVPTGTIYLKTKEELSDQDLEFLLKGESSTQRKMGNLKYLLTSVGDAVEASFNLQKNSIVEIAEPDFYLDLKKFFELIKDDITRDSNFFLYRNIPFFEEENQCEKFLDNLKNMSISKPPNLLYGSSSSSLVLESSVDRPVQLHEQSALCVQEVVDNQFQHPAFIPQQDPMTATSPPIPALSSPVHSLFSPREDHVMDISSLVRWGYTANNFCNLIQILGKAYGLAYTTRLAGYSGSNGSRDYHQMLNNPSLYRWNQIEHSLKDSKIVQ